MGKYFCPKCKSENVNGVSIFGIVPLRWKCKDCGFEGPTFPIKELNNKIKIKK